jgi:hypothetical protein
VIDARISIGLPSHPKTKKLIRRVGEAGAWRLVCLFLWAAQTRPDGNLSGMTAEDIELAADWTGKNDEFVKALVEVGFLDGTDGEYRIHDWSEHNPWAAGAEARSEKARWMALCKQHGRERAAQMMPEYAARISKAGQEDTKTIADSTNNSAISTATSTQCSMHAAGNSSAPSPLPSPSPLPTSFSEQPASTPEAEVGGPSIAARAGPSQAAVLSKALRAAGIEAQPADPRLMRLAEQGVTPETVEAAAAEARRAKPGERIPVGYVVGILERWARDAADISAGGAAIPDTRASPYRSRMDQQAETLAGLTGGLVTTPRSNPHEPTSAIAERVD